MLTNVDQVINVHVLAAMVVVLVAMAAVPVATAAAVLVAKAVVPVATAVVPVATAAAVLVATAVVPVAKAVVPVATAVVPVAMVVLREVLATVSNAGVHTTRRVPAMVMGLCRRKTPYLNLLLLTTLRALKKPLSQRPSQLLLQRPNVASLAIAPPLIIPVRATDQRKSPLAALRPLRASPPLKSR